MLPRKIFWKLVSRKRHILHSLNRTQFIHTYILLSFSQSLVIHDSQAEVQRFMIPLPPPIATYDREQFQFLNIVVSITKLDYYFWNSIDAKTSFSFLKIWQIARHRNFSVLKNGLNDSPILHESLVAQMKFKNGPILFWFSPTLSQKGPGIWYVFVCVQPALDWFKPGRGCSYVE